MRTSTFPYRLRLLLGIGLACGTAHQARAQDTGGPTATPITPTQVPIDGGASLLLAGSVAYGLRKLRQRHPR